MSTLVIHTAKLRYKGGRPRFRAWLPGEPERRGRGHSAAEAIGALVVLLVEAGELDVSVGTADLHAEFHSCHPRKGGAA